MNLKVKQGGNQKGLCFVSDEEINLEIGVYEISFRGKQILVDLRKSHRVPTGQAIIDSRIFSWLGCEDNAEAFFIRNTSNIPLCKELELSVSSTKELDNNAITDAISKRISDLKDDFDGLILQINQKLQLDHLGIQFIVNSLNSIDGSCHSCRVMWNDLEKMHLTPDVKIPAYNLICVIELGAAAHISDVLQNSTDGNQISIPRYEIAFEVLKQIILDYPGYGTGSHFSGFIYSDEVVGYSVFDRQTGTPVQSSVLYSKDLLQSFSDWARKEIMNHKNRPSNPGHALTSALQRGLSFPESSEHPTVILLCSSGVHTHGPDPVKVVKKSLGSRRIPIFCVSTGEGSNKDVLQAIAEITNGKMIEITSLSSVTMINETISQYFHTRS
jgi:hypothetical protein